MRVQLQDYTGESTAQLQDYTDESTVAKLYRARILKHLLEAEKSTFRKELSFERSESTTGLGQATVVVNDRKESF